MGGLTYHYDRRLAARAVSFFELLLVHSKGRWAGQPFKLLPWERRIVSQIFGWVDQRGLRRYRTAYITTAKKNGKTQLASGIGLYLTAADGEPGAEVYSVAADRFQARLSFTAGASMVELSPELSGRFEVYRNSLYYPATRSTWQVMSADAKGKHGPNPHGIIFDELHAQRDRTLYDTLTMGLGARDQPLLVVTTTAGEEEEGSIFCEVDDYADQVERGVIDDPTFFVFRAAAGKGDRWDRPATWKKANPSYGVTVRQEFFEAELKKARASPARRNTFRRLFLNLRTRSVARWIDLARWDSCYGKTTFAELERRCEGRLCYGGLDLSSKTDLTSLVLVFPPEDLEAGTFDALAYFWVPESRVAGLERATQASYEAWVEAGFLDTTPGDAIDYRTIRHRLTGCGELEGELELTPLADRFRIHEVAFDRWGAMALYPALEGDGLTMVEFGQGFRSMSEPTKELERLVLGKRLAHGAHPVLRWCVDCLEVKTDFAGNVKPAKPDTRKTARRIDGATALIMALSRACSLGATPAPESRYEEHEVRSL